MDCRDDDRAKGIPVAYNRASAGFMVSSSYMSGDYQRLFPGAAAYAAQLPAKTHLALAFGPEQGASPAAEHRTTHSKVEGILAPPTGSAVPDSARRHRPHHENPTPRPSWARTDSRFRFRSLEVHRRTTHIYTCIKEV